MTIAMGAYKVNLDTAGNCSDSLMDTIESTYQDLEENYDTLDTSVP